MKRCYLLLYLCTYAFYLSAQSDVFEFETNFQYCFEHEERLNFSYSSRNSPNLKNPYADARTKAIKVDLSKHGYSSTSYLSQSIFNLLTEGILQAYSVDGEDRLSVADITARYTLADTVVSLDPATFEERVYVVKNMDLNQVNCYAVKQDWQMTERGLNTKVVGLQPIMDDAKMAKPLLWIPMNQEQKQTNSIINNPSISWLKINKEVINIPAPMKTHALFKKMIWEDPRNGNVPIYAPDANLYGKDKELSKTYFQMELLQPSKDTIVTFDPETFAETVRVVENKPTEFEDIVALRIYQAWYLNHETQQLGCKLLGVTPLAKDPSKVTKEEKLIPLYLILFDTLE